MFVTALLLTFVIQLTQVAGEDYDRGANTCKEAGGERIFFDEYLSECKHVACADSGNDYRSLRAKSPENCQEICKATGGCNYWTWVPHDVAPNGHKNCKLYKNYCCFRKVNSEKHARFSGMKYQTDCFNY